MTSRCVAVEQVKRTIEVFDALAPIIRRPVIWDGCALMDAQEVADGCRILLAAKTPRDASGGSEESDDDAEVWFSDDFDADECERTYLREGWRYLGLYAQAALDPRRTWKDGPSERANALAAVLSAYITGTCATAAELNHVSPLGGTIAELAFLQLKSPPSTTSTNALAHAADAEDRARCPRLPTIVPQPAPTAIAGPQGDAR